MHSILITDCKTSNNAGSIFHTPSLSRFITGPLLIAIYHHFPRVFSSSSYPSSHSSSSHSSSEIQCAGLQRGPGKTSIKRTCLSAYLVPMASHTHPQSAELVSGAGVALMKVTSSSSRVSREERNCARRRFQVPHNSCKDARVRPPCLFVFFFFSCLACLAALAALLRARRSALSLSFSSPSRWACSTHA